MKKRIIAGSVVGMLAMASANATITFEGDRYMLEGAEGHIVVYKEDSEDSVDVNPGFEYVSGAAVHITIDSANPRKANVVPDEVSSETESTIRITVGSETIDHTFKVVNEAEPEQAKGKTIGQCTFYNNYKGHTGLAGMGAFSFDKRTVNNIYMKNYSDWVYDLISTTRVILGSVDSGLTVFDENGRLHHVQDSFVTGGLYQAWYAGPGSGPGYSETGGRGGGNHFINGWSNADAHYTYYPAGYFNFNGDGNYANDSLAHGSWSAKHPYPTHPEGDEVAVSEGYFDCALSDVGNMSACGGSFDLPNNQWQQISLPCYSFSSGVLDIFANIPGTYDSDWVVYEYNKDNTNKYAKLGVGDRLEQGKGYWIIQGSGATVTLAMPQGSIPTLVTQHAGCTGEKGCSEIPLVTSSSNHQWNLVGFPFGSPQSLSRVRIATHSQGCNTRAGCTLSSANNQGFVYNQLWRYVDSKVGYTKITAKDTLTPWSGYWSLTLPNAEAAGPVGLIVPKP